MRVRASSMVMYAIPILAFVLFASSAMWAQGQRPTAPVTVENTDADAVPVKVVEDGSRIRMVGFSSGKDTGNAGRLALDRLCRQDFPGSRMCRTAEALATVDRSELTAGAGWIDPSSIETHLHTDRRHLHRLRPTFRRNLGQTRTRVVRGGVPNVQRMGRGWTPDFRDMVADSRTRTHRALWHAFRAGRVRWGRSSGVLPLEQRGFVPMSGC
jgi:hypothetical protein